MNILIVGGGGREHALASKLRRDDPDSELFAAPGNPGIAALARCVPIGAGKLEELAAFAENERIDLTVVGPEGPLDAGIVNLFQSRGLPIFGPTREAAQIETSKRFAKESWLRSQSLRRETPLTRCSATGCSAMPAARFSSRSSWRAKSSRCLSSLTVSVQSPFSRRRTTSGFSTAISDQTRAGWVPTRRHRSRHPSSFGR